MQYSVLHGALKPDKHMTEDEVKKQRTYKSYIKRIGVMATFMALAILYYATIQYLDKKSQGKKTTLWWEAKNQAVWQIPRVGNIVWAQKYWQPGFYNMYQTLQKIQSPTATTADKLYSLSQTIASVLGMAWWLQMDKIKNILLKKKTWWGKVLK